MRYGCSECGAGWHTSSANTNPLMCPECGGGETFVDTLGVSVLASQHVDALSLSFSGAAITASAPSRTLAGPIVRYNAVGRTSRGPLRVAPGALRFPEDLSRVKLTKEHDRATVRGHLVAVEHTSDGIRASLKVSDGPEGDAALTEAADRTRDAFSYDCIDATITGDTITDGLVIAIGQVGIPAYDDARIDTIAASNNTGENMTDAQRARLAELRALATRTAEQEAEMATLVALEAANPPVQAAQPPVVPAAPAAPVAPAAAAPTGTEQVAASMPAVPGSTLTGTTQVNDRKGTPLQQFVADVTAAFAPGNTTKVADITAALADITNSANSVIEQPAWSGELWSGLLYEPQWTDLFNSGDLTSWEGVGWRFTKKLAIADYAGDKAEIPTDTITTEASGYEAARMAVGVDVDRKFFDFPNAGFVQSLFEQVRESWAMQLDAKIRAYTLANAVAAEGVVSEPTLLKAAAAAIRALKRRRVGKASFIYVNDDDLFTLLDVAEKDVSAFLELFDVDPKNFRSSQDVPAGTVLAGVRPAATVRTLPGSPIRVDAQNLANGGVDEAFFGYWAIEEHHTAGIAKVTFAPA